MKPREKLLIAVVAGFALLLGGGLGLRAFIARPLSEMDKKISAARARLEKAETERRNFFNAEDRLKASALLTFADTIDEASARSGELLTKQILQAGLDEANFTRLPLGPRKMRGASEIGWNVQGEGALSNVVNLLFLLERSPHLQRVDSFAVSHGDGPGIVRVHFRCLTLIIDPPPDIRRTPLIAKLGLDSTERHVLDGIVTRDLLRPYIKRPPALEAKAGPGAGVAGKSGKPPGPEALRIVSLTEWQGRPEVHVRDTVREKTQRYQPGDSLGGGTIALVDYRPLPHPSGNGLQSFSRVILRIGTEFWAVEHGQTLAELRRLESSQLPPGLTAAK